MNKSNDWITDLIVSSSLLEAKQAIACINNGLKPIIIDEHSTLQDFDEVLETRINNLKAIEKGNYENFLLYSTIELLNNIRSTEVANFICAAIPTENGRFLLYITPGKKWLFGCIFVANKKFRPYIFESVIKDSFPEVKEKSKKRISSYKWLEIVIAIAVLVIILWPHISWQVTKYLNISCTKYMTEEKYFDAFSACSKRMKEGDRSAMLLVGKLYERGKGVEKNYEKSEKIYRELTNKNDTVSSLAYEGLGDLYKTQEFERINYSESARFYKISADMGLASSQFQYGMALYIGRGVDIDEEKAFDYIKKSASGGNKHAIEILPALPNEELLNLIRERVLGCDNNQC